MVGNLIYLLNLNPSKYPTGMLRYLPKTNPHIDIVANFLMSSFQKSFFKKISTIILLKNLLYD